MRMLGIALATGVALMAGSTGNVHGNSFGDARAPVLIEVFSDFECPGCKAFHDNDFPHLMADYVIPGKVRIIYRYFPLPQHNHGKEAAEWVCAASRIDEYEKVAAAVFASQAEWSVKGDVAEFVEKALSPAQFRQVKSLLKSSDVQRQIETDLEEGRALPVTATPMLAVTKGSKTQPIAAPNYELLKSYLNGLVQ